MEPRTGVIIVLYHSEKQNYQSLSRCPNVDVILVDNTPRRDLNIVDKNVHYIPLRENKGIAAAQNVGISKAYELGCTYIELFDQDSVIPPNYVNKIQFEFERLKMIYPTLSVLGPTVINKESGHEYKSVKTTINHECKLVSALISSGSFYELATVWNEVGLMEEDLFIDYVDFEWCWRSMEKGYVCAITQRLKLQHKVGQCDHVFMGYPIIQSAPVRYYYQYRNFLWLIRRNYVPLKWKINAGIRKLAEIILLPFYVKAKLAILKNIFLGIKDGLCHNNYIR